LGGSAKSGLLQNPRGLPKSGVPQRKNGRNSPRGTHVNIKRKPTVIQKRKTLYALIQPNNSYIILFEIENNFCPI
jgi:hypothetical protein